MKRTLFLLLLIIISTNAWCLPFIGVDTGLLIIINTEQAGAPSPVILQGLGITLPLIDNESMFLHAGALFYGCQYQMYLNRAIPADNELANTIWVLFSQFDLRIGLPYKLSPQVTIGASLGPTLIFPLPLFTSDNGESYRAAMFNYFYGNLKFLYAETELFLRWAIVNGVNLAFKARGTYALWAIWDDPNISRFINGFQIQGLISMEIQL